MTENKMNLMQKIAKARVMLQKKNLKKSGQNKFANFKYFELADFLPAVNEIFDELGLYAEFFITPEDRSIDDGTGQILVQPEIAHLNIYNSENPTEQARHFTSMIAEAGTKGATPIQQLGSVHTYMRRYLYMEALEIVESDALDAVAGSDKAVQAEPKKQKPKQEATEQITGIQYASPIQIEKITKLFEGYPERYEAMLQAYRVNKVEELTVNQAHAVIKRMEGAKA